MLEFIFVFPMRYASSVRARVFGLHEELDFAGHPLLGAASVLHALHGAPGTQTWSFELNQKRSRSRRSKRRGTIGRSSTRAARNSLVQWSRNTLVNCSRH